MRAASFWWFLRNLIHLRRRYVLFGHFTGWGYCHYLRPLRWLCDLLEFYAREAEENDWARYEKENL